MQTSLHSFLTRLCDGAVGTALRPFIVLIERRCRRGRMPQLAMH